MRPNQPSHLYDKRALPGFLVLGFALLVFAYVSAILAPFNFDLHHDGYSLTQSWRVVENPTLSGDILLQYGILYHYVLGGLLSLGDGSPMLSRYVAIGLVLSSAAILFKASGRHRLLAAMASVSGCASLLVQAISAIFRSVPSQPDRASAVAVVLYVLHGSCKPGG